MRRAFTSSEQVHAESESSSLASSVDTDATKEFTNRIISVVNDKDLDHILEKQMELRSNLQRNTTKLTAFNEFSTARYSELVKKFEIRVKIIRELKGDLDQVFKRIRNLKAKYPANIVKK
ncbi:uncharacterized protein VTP21DRAFT_2738 [Calcarisporiella thermophila]|uniref:uncharacterized protein n=1 Tax=Calcarisporiella thermophila TaxID=911321 RepID=UPI0037425AE3